MSLGRISLVKDKQTPDPVAGEQFQLIQAFDAVRAELKVPGGFPPDVLAEAEGAAGSAALPQRDETALPFLTIDPPGSMDLDQSLHIERVGKGYRVRYARPDVTTFVRPVGPIDIEARRRGQTIYAPDHPTPLHPEVLGEGVASLLPNQVRPAYLGPCSSTRMVRGPRSRSTGHW